MTYPTKGIVIAIAAAVIAGPAIAADLLPRPAAPLAQPRLPTAPVGMTWSGFYIGGNLGAALNPKSALDTRGIGLTARYAIQGTLTSHHWHGWDYSQQSRSRHSHHPPCI